MLLRQSLRATKARMSSLSSTESSRWECTCVTHNALSRSEVMVERSHVLSRRKALKLRSDSHELVGRTDITRTNFSTFGNRWRTSGWQSCKNRVADASELHFDCLRNIGNSSWRPATFNSGYFSTYIQSVHKCIIYQLLHVVVIYNL